MQGPVFACLQRVGSFAGDTGARQNIIHSKIFGFAWHLCLHGNLPAVLNCLDVETT
jgi:hypothetical protein